MNLPIGRQTSAFILSRKQPDYRRFLYKKIDFNEPLIGIKGARGSGKTTLMLCSTPPAELNKSKLSSAVGASWPTLSKYLERIQAGSLIHMIRGGTGMRAVNKPDKLLLNNPNLFQILCASPNTGTLREAFFVSQLSHAHQVHYHDRSDFIVDDKYIFEIGGAQKTSGQLGDQANAYVVSDDIETGTPKQIPLWIFGMNY